MPLTRHATGWTLQYKTLEQRQVLRMELEQLTEVGELTVALRNLLVRGLEADVAEETLVGATLGQDGEVHLKTWGLKSEAGEVTLELSPALPSDVALVDTPQRLLRTLQRLLLTRNAMLLKLHLDLCSQAAESALGLSGFHYRLNDALKRLGITLPLVELPAALAQLYGGLESLSLNTLEIYTSGAKTLKTPAWVILSESSYIKGDALEQAQLLLPNPDAPIYKTMHVVPGVWWQVMEMAGLTLHIPRRLLNLPIDTDHAENRLALRLAAALSVWHRGCFEKTLTVGELLEGANLTSLEELTYDLYRQGKRARRLRKYLMSKSGKTGAFKVLREGGGLEVTVPDSDAFWSFGKGWLEDFWGATLKVQRV